MKKKTTEKLRFEKLYDIYEQKIFFCAYNILHQKEQAEDITQDIFEQLYQNQKIWRDFDDAHLTKYILKITKNKAIDLYRKNNNQIKYLDHYRKNEDTGQIKFPIEEDLIGEEMYQTLINELNEPYRQVFMYRAFYGLTFKETADLLLTREDTVRKQYERARVKLQSILGGTKNNEKTN